MRIAIDFQGAQTGSRFRGIGHYSTELVKAMIMEGKGHEFILVLNGAFPESIEPIRASFEGILPQKNIRVWYSDTAIEHFGEQGSNIREISQIIREHFIRSLEPDIIVVTSIFEALGEPAVVTVKEYVADIPTAAIFYDFTPLIVQDNHFRTSIPYHFWYRHRVEQVGKCDLIFAISESSRQELHRFIDFPHDNSFNIFGGHSPDFTVKAYSEQERAEKLRRLGISRPFILYAGGLEPNKNLKRLVEALSLLPERLKTQYEFVVVGKRNPGEEDKILSLAIDGNSKKMINVVGYVSHDDLIDLYNLCSLFVFPSLREGLGLPPIEAMACGAPTIVSNRSSLPEVVLNPQACFDPMSVSAIAEKIEQVLLDDVFCTNLVRSGLMRAKVLTWENSAQTLLSTLEERVKQHRHYDESRRSVVLRTTQSAGKRLRILVLKLDHNGDFLLAVPAFSKLRARYPDAQIDVVAGSWNSAAANALGIFNNIFNLDYFKARSSARPGLVEEELETLLADMPFYDFAIDLRRQSETRFLLLKMPANRYFGYDTGEQDIDRFLTNSLPRYPEPAGVHSPFDASHASEQMLRLIDQLPFSPTDYVSLPEMSRQQPVQPGSVAIFPRVGNDARQWDTERFAALIDVLAANDQIERINLYGGRLEELETIQFKPSVKIAMHAGLRFPELLSSLSANQVCVGNNSFGVHLGSYAGCQTIGIYSGHELPQHWGPPFGDAYAITADAPCSPCHLPDKQSCPFDTFCLSDISVQTVERVILDAVEGRAIREDYSKIVRANPASAIQSLVQEITNCKHHGRISTLSDSQKTILAAAIAANFPERASLDRIVYLDVTGLRSDVPGGGRTQARLTELEALADAGGLQGNVVFIGAGQHDHEFYMIENKDLFELDRVLLNPDRHNRVVRPIAGDIYLGPDIYLGRNPALWNLLATWRQNGIEVIMQAPDQPFTGEDEEAQTIAAYLYKLAHFDAIITRSNQKPVLQEWVGRFAPPRLRPLRILESRPDISIAMDENLMANLLAIDAGQAIEKELT